MNEAHLIEIDHLVIADAGRSDPPMLSGMVAAELRRQIAIAAAGQGHSLADVGRVSHEIAGSVVQSVQGGASDG